MGLGILNLLDSYPQCNSCCFCVSLRSGVLYGACMGIVWSILHLFAYTHVGVTTLKGLGVPDAVCEFKGVRYFHYALGVILCAAHALLLGATLAKSRSLCALYAGTSMAIASTLTVLSLIVSFTALSLGLITMGVTFVILLLDFIAALVLLYMSAMVANYSSTIPHRK